MTRLTKLNKLKGFLQGAPKANIAKMENVLQNYREGVVNNFRTVENAMIALSHPNMFGPRKVVEYYNKAMGVQRGESGGEAQGKLHAEGPTLHEQRFSTYRRGERPQRGAAEDLQEIHHQEVPEASSVLGGAFRSHDGF